MFDWFKPKWPQIASLPSEWGSWTIATAMVDGKGLLIRILTEKSIVGHPNLPLRLGLALEHPLVDGVPTPDLRLYEEIEERLCDLLEKPERVGVFVLRLTDERMAEWVSYVMGREHADYIAGELMTEYADHDLTGMREDDPKWTVYRHYRPGH